MPRTKFKLGDLVTFTRIISSEEESCKHCEGRGNFEDDTHYGGICSVACSKCQGKGRWKVSVIPPYKKVEGPFKITSIKTDSSGTTYMLNQNILRDWKYDPKWFSPNDLKKFKGGGG